ncbi:MAG: TIM barrel protein [Actinomycetota bacterium]|nr:TIM barrel protein [Actinomycetota bacterium]
MSHHLPYAANCSLLFCEAPLPQRPAAARAKGFDAVEFWWPWPAQPVPDDRDVDAFIASTQDAGVRLIGLNFFAGDLGGTDCGVLSVPARSREFHDNIDVAVAIGRTLGVGAFNALYGNRIEGVDPGERDQIGTANLVAAAHAAAEIGATVLVEPVSGPKPYPLRTAADVVTVLDRVRAAGAANLGLLCDLFHLATNGEDVPAVITAYAERVTHVQIADSPGRGEPGSGRLDLDAYLSQLEPDLAASMAAAEPLLTSMGERIAREWLS